MYTDAWIDPEWGLYKQVQWKEKGDRDLWWIMDSRLEGQKGGGWCKLGKRDLAKVKEQLLGSKKVKR